MSSVQQSTTNCGCLSWLCNWASSDSSPEAAEVNQKVGKVYTYVAAAFAATVATAKACAHTNLAWTAVSMYSGLGSGLFLVATSIALIALTAWAPKNSTLKHAAYGAFALWQGFVLSPLVLINSTAFLAAGAITAATMGTLGIAAMRMKESFEKYEKILFVALGAIALASLGALALPEAAAAWAHEISLFGGLATFSAFTIYDTHKAREEAKKPKFDTIDHAMGIYLDTLNLFIRIFELYDRYVGSKQK